MDPLSITASILTLLSTVGAVLKGLEHLRSRMNPGAEFLTLMNSVSSRLDHPLRADLTVDKVTDVQATLITVRDCTETLKNSKAPAAQQSYQNLPNAVNKVQISLDRLVDFIRDSFLRKENRLSRLSLNESKKKKVARAS